MRSRRSLEGTGRKTCVVVRDRRGTIIDRVGSRRGGRVCSRTGVVPLDPLPSGILDFEIEAGGRTWHRSVDLEAGESQLLVIE